MKMAKDMTKPSRGALNRPGSTIDATKNTWKASIGMKPKMMGSNVMKSKIMKG